MHSLIFFRETQSYYGIGHDSEESDGESGHQRVGEETKSLILKEFAERKKRVEERKITDTPESAKNSKCRAAESTATKVIKKFIITTLLIIRFIFQFNLK